MMKDKQHGMSLVLVMAIIAAVTLVMLTEVNRRAAESRDRQLYFTLAQTEYILNSAYAFYTRNGHWPVDRGDCQLPNDFLEDDSIDQEIFNGWGEEVVAAGGCRNNGEYYRLVQRIPDVFVDAITDRISDQTVRYDRDNGFTDVEILMNQSGGASRVMTIGDFSESYFNPLRYNVPVCMGNGGSTTIPLEVVVGISGACSDISGTVARGGFRTRTRSDRSVYYDYFRVVTDPVYNDEGDHIGDEYTIDGGEQYSGDVNHADVNCPTETPYRNSIQALVLAWCSPTN